MIDNVKEAQVRRRTVVKGFVWSVPVIAVASSAPLAAASGPCKPVVMTIKPDMSTAPDSQTLTLVALVGSDTYTVTLKSTISDQTVVGQKTPHTAAHEYLSYNLSTAGNGWAGQPPADGSADYVFKNFAPAAGAGAVVLNQRTKVNPEPTGTTPIGTDLQTITFAFAKNGVPFDPTSVVLDIFDITSVASNAWRMNYWDAVGFSQPPTSISYTGTVASYGRGAGTGSITDPYRRTLGTQGTASGQTVSDRFTFGAFPSGTTMQYTNYSGRQGWHFISISGIQFTHEECN